MTRKEQVDKLNAKYKYVFNTPEGRAVLADLEDRWEVNGPLGVRMEPEMYYYAALRDARQYITERLKDE
jgi:hypothetical protein